MRLPKDEIDLAQLASVTEAPGFAMIASRMRDAVRTCETQLRTCEPGDLRYIQGQIAGLERALAIPKILHDDITSALKRKRR